MPEQVGKIVRMPNRFPGPPTIAVNTVGEGLRKHINLCFACTRFKPSEPDHCPIAQEHFEFCKDRHVGTAIVRCANYDNTVNVAVSEAAGAQG